MSRGKMFRRAIFVIVRINPKKMYDGFEKRFVIGCCLSKLKDKTLSPFATVERRTIFCSLDLFIERDRGQPLSLSS